uniref:Laminin subunit beta-1 n=1 Tax=Rhabditophanes sp. KR3021 TaxID=114890 RepID=A0AC35UH10_9BILA
MKLKKSCLIWFIPVLCLFLSIRAEALEEEDVCFDKSCYPATGNLLLGRKNRLSTTSTCGLRKKNKFCIVSNLDGDSSCYYCDSTKPWKPYPDSARLSHRIENIVTENQLDRNRKWWQSENGVQNVSIRLDLEVEFHFTHLIMTFKTFRPAAMFIERSSDFGRTWSVYRYFAYDCAESFPHIKEERPKNHGDVICTSAYSAVSPSNGGELVYKVISPQIKTVNPYGDEVGNLLKITNLRINFTKLHTLGDDLLDYRPEIHQKYYYSLYELVVRGSCSCYGHAKRCISIGDEVGVTSENSDMVHGRCECSHNTKGMNCEKCDDFFNDLPWRPALGNKANECRKCECNNHATTCHFDKAIYQASQYTSGGVCDSCQHNTFGKNCEQCVPFYYKDKNVPMNDPRVCRPCLCNKEGSLNNGICESEEDPERNLVAGRCYCKENIDSSSNCDKCKNGFWNMNTENPLGCQACTCNTLGTYNNEGCDKNSGECFCKRLVTGANCDKCLDEHYGLSEDIDGCKACDCDIGGSLGNKCDLVSGQCKCKPHFSGRRCDTTESSFFCANIDHYTLEAEDAQSTGTGNVIEPREKQKSENSHKTWTGIGFMKVKEKSVLTFNVDDIARTMDYNVVIRYETEKDSIGWENIQVILTRMELPDPTGPCANTNPENDMLLTRLSPQGKYLEVEPSICLEANKKYTIAIVFGEKRSNNPDRSATMLVDSIVLVPPTQNLEIFNGTGTSAYHLKEYNEQRCRDYIMHLTPIDKLPQICQRYICPIAASIMTEGLQCDCDPTGSISGICRPQGGQCECKLNVIGRRCDQCAEGTFGFGPGGCIPCDCDSVGSLNNFCHKQTGQCLCSGDGITGRQCNECHPGFWKFPHCQGCQCNEHANICDQKSGACLECRDLTDGPNCDRCLAGYWGDPRVAVNIPCKACRCPNGPSSGAQHADSCYPRSSLNSASEDIVCNCKVGYKNKNCDECAANYWGNPKDSGGSCQKCDCNGNINFNEEGNCDSESGDCLKCLYHTVGDQCQHCVNGYYGDAKIKNCQKCQCNSFGTNTTDEFCDNVSGQCKCLPNVIGKQCNVCQENYFNLESGKGCLNCGCDPSGVILDNEGFPILKCDEMYGQCSCQKDRGGRTCSECKDLYWGNAVSGQCTACECNPYGSIHMQCNREDGTCSCKEGSGGPLCNTCARGYTGEWPNCKTCGECFQNWDKILTDLTIEMDSIIDKANNIEDTGIVSVYDNEFNEMEVKIDTIKKQLVAANMSHDDISLLKDKIIMMNEKLLKSYDRYNVAADLVTGTANEYSIAKSQAQMFSDDISKLELHAQDYAEKVMSLKERDIIGAYNITKDSYNKAQGANEISSMALTNFNEALSQFSKVESLLDNNRDLLQKNYIDNKHNLEVLQNEYNSMNSSKSKINHQVCGKETTTCDSVCGGPISKCGHCGGNSCHDGSVSKAQQAEAFLSEAFEILISKQKEAERKLSEFRNIRREIDLPTSEIDKLHAAALLSSVHLNETIISIEKLVKEIEEFSESRHLSPDEIKELYADIYNIRISKTSNEIEGLSNEIRQKLEKIKNVDDILNETRQNKIDVTKLAKLADKASTKSETISNKTSLIREKLGVANTVYLATEQILSDAQAQIEQAKLDYNKALSESQEAESLLIELKSKFEDLDIQWKNSQIDNLQSVKMRQVVHSQGKKLAEVIESSSSEHERLLESIEQLRSLFSEKEKVYKDPKVRAQNLRNQVTSVLTKTLSSNTEIDSKLK